MSTAEEKHKTARDNEGKISEDIDSGNNIMTKEVSNHELDKIMENINSEDQIPNLVEDKMEEVAEDNPNETLSPYNRSESQDEDLLLRWDDEDIDDDQEKNDDIMLQEIEVLRDEISGEGKPESCLISETYINTNDLVSNRANDTEADAILKIDIKKIDNATNLIIEYDADDDHNTILTTDDKDNNGDTSKRDNEASDIIIRGDGIVNFSSSDTAIVQISNDDDVVVCSTSRICDSPKDIIIGDIEMSGVATQDIHNRSSSFSEANISYALCIDQNKITEDISEKNHKALETDDFVTSSVPSEEIVQENTPLIPKAGETNISNIIDENKIIKDINDKITKALSEVNKPQENGDQDTEPEEKSCDENIKFLEQQLKVLAKSINSNLDKHTNIVPDIVHTNLGAASKPTSELESAIAGTVPNDDDSATIEVSNREMDVDEITPMNPQDHKSQSPNDPEIVPNIDSRIDKTNFRGNVDLQVKIDDNIDKNQNSNTSEIVQSIDSSLVQENIEKDISPKMDRGIKILNVDQINKNINTHKPENVQNIDTHKESDTLVEIDGDGNIEDCKIDKNLNANESDVVHIDFSSRKENNVTNDTATDVKLRPEDNIKQKESEVEKVSDSNKPEKYISESEEDDDVVEIIERCDNYIDLSSQSPINLDNEIDPEVLKESLGPTEDSGKRDKTKSNSDSYNVNTDHRLRPDVMLEIPMHNLIDVDDIDESINIDSEETSQDSVSKETAVKGTEVQVITDIKEENISTLEKDIDNLDLTHEKSEKKLKEIRHEISNLNMKIQNEPACRLGQQITENDSNLIKTELNDSNQPKTKSIDANIKDENIKKESAVKKEKDIGLESAFATRMTPDTADEAPEVSDSLGLLAESSRVRREDEEIEEDEDDDDDYDQDDESSNQMTAEHSEDSNAQHSEPDSKDQEDKTGGKERSFNFKESDNRDVGGEVVEGVVASDAVDSVEKGSKDVCNESTSVEKNEEQSKKDGELTLPSTDIDIVKSSDNSEKETEAVSGKEALKSLPSTHQNSEEKSSEKIVQSPSKAKKLEISMPRLVLNIVDLEESSSEEDTPEVLPIDQDPEPEKLDDVGADVTSVNIPTEIEIMSTSCGNTSQIVTKEGEVVIQGVPKPPPHKPARLNTSEVTIKTAHASSESTLIIPETKMSESTEPQLGLEVFNLDSDDDDLGGSGKATGGRQKLTALELDAALRSGRCLRRGCTAGARGSAAGPLGHYCEECANAHYLRTQSLVEGIKNMTPLLELNMEKLSQDLVEISDSDSENEVQEPKETIGNAGAALLEENLAHMINSMWHKYKMDASLTDAKEMLDAEMERLDNESKEINKMLNECQSATDKLRNELYATFEPKRQEQPAVVIYDNANGVIISLETDSIPDQDEVRHGKRRLSAATVQPAKRPAIPMGYTPLDAGMALVQNEQDQSSMLMAGEYSNRYEDDKDVSVVQLSAEAAPADLPPPGEPKRPPLKIGMQVYAMRNAFGSWSKARIIEAMKLTGLTAQFPSFRVKFDHKVKNPCKVLSARCLAYVDPADVRLTIGTRVIALFKESSNQAKTESYYSGIIAEIPNPVNNYRYLVFFDDGYAQYASHTHTRIVCASAAPVWEEVHPFSREFVRNYLCAYPERPMVRLHAGQRLNTEWNGKWWDSRVIQVDASLVQVHFEEDNRTEWIYRGSTRLEPLFLELQAAVRHRGRHLPRSKAQLRTNMPYVEYTRSYEQDKSTEYAQQEELRRQRSVAKKSTANTLNITSAGEGPDAFASRVVYYTPRNAVRPYKMVSHTCGPKCKRSDVLTLKELRSYNPLAKPLLSGWERQLVRNKGAQAVLYRAPCGRRLRSARELQRYLRLTRSDAPIDLFDFNPETHCLAEFVLSKCIVGKKDLSHGKENVPVPCVNSVDESLPEFCSYNTERTPTAGVPLNLDPEFLCGCDCTDDCEDKTKCACWQLTLEGAKTIGIEGTNVGYEFKRLPEPLPSGIYECNVRCKCKATCLNRVAQHPLQLKLQVFKTPNRGWGIRALNDVPKGAFLCVYAGNLLTDATANLDGLNEGDEYLAELDYIEVVEQMKEGYEEDVPEADKILDKKDCEKKEEKSSTEAESSSEDEETVSKDEEQDDDFRPGYIGLGLMEFNKRLRRRGKKKDQEEDQKAPDTVKKEDKEQNADEDCITISDDEEVREPSRFTAQAGMGASEYVPKYRSVRAHFGRDEACYIMDAKVQGNIGRYLNHSCCPNVFVQNVFVDTHDPRFPWVAFFALSHIRAGTELTWNYNYDVGSVPGKVLYCYCGAPNCRRRLL